MLTTILFQQKIGKWLSALSKRGYCKVAHHGNGKHQLSTLNNNSNCHKMRWPVIVTKAKECEDCCGNVLQSFLKNNLSWINKVLNWSKQVAQAGQTCGDWRCRSESFEIIRCDCHNMLYIGEISSHLISFRSNHHIFEIWFFFLCVIRFLCW